MGDKWKEKQKIFCNPALLKICHSNFIGLGSFGIMPGLHSVYIATLKD